MSSTSVLFVAALLCSTAALRTQKDPDTDHMVHEAVDHSDTHKNLSPSEKDFASLDTNSDKQLSKDELMFRQYATGCDAVESYIRATDYMQCGDSDNNGKISPCEFDAAKEPTWLKCIMAQDDRRAHGFMRFIDADEDINDKLSLTELRVALEKLWGPPGAELTKPLMGCADGDGDGMISQKEFHDTIAFWNPVTRKFEGDNKKVLTCLDTAMVNFDKYLAFLTVDTNDDNKVSKPEAYTAMSEMGPNIKQPTAEALFAAADTNKDGYLSREEFNKAGESYKGEGESFILTGAGAKVLAPLAAGAQATGMGAACAARKTLRWSFFSTEAPNAKLAKNGATILSASKGKNMTYATIGPFDSKEDACDYCFGSFTRSQVVRNCICTAYDADDGPTMFCTATPSGMKYIASKPGGCKCTQNNAAAMGKTTCDPIS